MTPNGFGEFKDGARKNPSTQGGVGKKLHMKHRRRMRYTRHVEGITEKEVHTTFWQDNVKESHVEDLGVGGDNIKMYLQEIVFTGCEFMEK